MLDVPHTVEGASRSFRVDAPASAMDPTGFPNPCFFGDALMIFPLPSVLVSTAYHGGLQVAIENGDLPDNLVLTQNCACDNIRGRSSVHTTTESTGFGTNSGKSPCCFRVTMCCGKRVCGYARNSSGTGAGTHRNTVAAYCRWSGISFQLILYITDKSYISIGYSIRAIPPGCGNFLPPPVLERFGRFF
jgi:hypothetical protein